MAEETKETGNTTRTSRSTRSTRTPKTERTPSANNASSTSVTKAPSSRSSASKKTTAPAKKKGWADKVSEKNKKLDKLLSSTRAFGGRLPAGTIKEIKKRVSDKGPSAVTRMHFLGTPRQRKNLALEIQRILDA